MRDSFNTSIAICIDLQKLEREGRICRMLKHANIGEFVAYHVVVQSL